MDSTKLSLALLTAALFAVAAGFTPASRAAAQTITPATVDLSAQAKPDDQNKNKNKAQNVQQNKTQNVQQQKKVEQKKIEHKKIEVKKEQRIKKIEVKKEQRTKKIEVKKERQIKKREVEEKKNIHVDKKVTGTQQTTVKKKFTGTPKKFVPKENHVVHKFKLRNSRQAFVHGKNYSVYRNNYRVRHNGRWRTFVALGALAPLLIGAYEFYPYAYMDVPGDYCEGLTDDGCELVYDEVETVDGDTVLQCVAYCPWQ